MKKWKSILLGVVGIGLLSCASVQAQTRLIDGPSGNSLQERTAQAFKSTVNTDGSFNKTDYRIVQLSPDVTEFSIATGTYFYTGSNTTATAIGTITGEVAGQVFTIVTTGGANWTTIADSSPFNISGAWAPDSADDSISFLVQGADDFIQIGTQTNN